MIINQQEIFFRKSLESKGPVAIYEHCLQIMAENNGEHYEESISYLKMFVQFPGDLCEGIIRADEWTSLSTIPWGTEYITALSYIAAYHLDKDENEIGILWANKAADMYRYFTPGLDDEGEKKIFYDTVAHVMIYERQQYFCESAYENFTLEWEYDRVISRGYRVYHNDNDAIFQISSN